MEKIKRDRDTLGGLSWGQLADLIAEMQEEMDALYLIIRAFLMKDKET